MLKKITSKNGFVFLFIDNHNEKLKGLGIASGESVLLSIYENDKFYFSNNINLIKYESILLTEEPTKLEKKFFELMKENKEMKSKRSLVNEFEISKYIHYFPKITYKQSINDGKILVQGTVKYPENIYEREVPKILLNNESIPLNEGKYFEYIVDFSMVGKKLNFMMDLPKQTVLRAYTVKKTKK